MAFSSVFVLILIFLFLVLRFGLPGTHFPGLMQQEKQTSAEHLQHTTDLLKGHLHFLLKERQRDHQLLASHLSGWMDEGLDVGILRSLRQMGRSLGMREVALAALDGTIQLSTDQENPFLLSGMDQGMLIRMGAPLQRESIFLRLGGHEGQELGIVFVERILSADGLAAPGRDAYLISVLDVGMILNSLRRQAVGLHGKWEVLLVDARLGVLNRRIRENMGSGHDLSNLAALRRRAVDTVMVGQEGLFSAVGDPSGEGLVAFRFLPFSVDFGLGLVVLTDVEEVFTAARATVQAVALVMLVFSAVVLGIIYFLASGLTRPMRGLTDTVLRAAGGDLSVRAQSDQKGEMGRLIEGVNALIGRVQEWEESLRREVAARTEALRDKNRQLVGEVNTRLAVERNLANRLQLERISGEVIREGLGIAPLQDKLERIFYRILQAGEGALFAGGELLLVEGAGQTLVTVASRGDMPPRASDLLEDNCTRLGQVGGDPLLASQCRQGMHDGCALPRDAGFDGYCIPIQLEGSSLGLLKLKVDRGRVVSSEEEHFIDVCVYQLAEIIVRQRTEEALLLAEERLRGILENSLAVIFLKDHKRRYLLVNRRFEQTFGVEGGQIRGRADADLFEDAVAQHLSNGDERVLDFGLPVEEEREIPTAHGKRTFIVVKFALFDHQGHPNAICGLATDITDRARIEQQLRQSQKMEAIGTLAGGIAHDFNNILAAIIGYTELSLLDVPKEMPLRAYLEAVLLAGRRATELVRQILTFSRQVDGEVGPMLIQPSVKEALKLLRAVIPANISIVQDLQAEDSRVRATPAQIHQIVMNLCANAHQAMEGEEGEVRVTLREVTVTEADRRAGLAPGHYLQLAVSDSGHGMEQEVLARAFEPFFTTKAPGKGSGMGLSVIHGIVATLGGDIWIDSAPRAGTTVEVHLPMVGLEEGEVKASLSLPMAEVAAGKRILLVDDEPALARMWRAQLEMDGFLVETFSDSGQALATARARPHSFDLIITDQAMPQVTGMRLAREMLDIRPNMPIILMTGHSENVTPGDALRQGIRAFLHKPLEREALLAAVREALSTENG